MSAYKFKNKIDDTIITDAGWQNISYEEAVTIFSEKELFDYWQKVIEDLDVDDIALELGFSLSDYDVNSIEYENIIDEIYDKKPMNVSVIVAKAVYKEHKLVSIISLPTFEPDFSVHESKSIVLGLMLQKELGEEIEIVNDCKTSVLKFRTELGLLSIFWARRNNTKKAHNLKIEQANRIVSKTELDIFENGIHNST